MLSAQTVRVHSVSIGRFMQSQRIDKTVDAPRSFQQALRVSAYDALGDGSQSVDVHLGFRYFTDFGLDQRLRSNPWLGRDWNELTLEQAWVTWRPYDRVVLRGGRQFVVDALGMRDFDGASVRIRPRLSRSVDAHLEVWGGRDVQFETGDFSSDSYDVQGLPIDSDYVDGTSRLVGGARGGLNWNRASFELAYFRRQYELDVDDEFDSTVLGEERVGAAISGIVADKTNVTFHGSYHTVLGDVDRAGARAASHIGWTDGIVSGGLDYVVPTFDASSIFNLFGANPHQGGWLAYRQPVESLKSSFEVRGWGRILHADFDARDFGSGEDDAVAWGAALAHHTRFSVSDTPVRWRTLASFQTSVDAAYGSDQWLFDTRFDVPVRLVDGLWTNARGLLLIADAASPRYDSGWATSGVFGFEWRSGLGTFSSSLNINESTFSGSDVQGWLAFELEEWI